MRGMSLSVGRGIVEDARDLRLSSMLRRSLNDAKRTAKGFVNWSLKAPSGLTSARRIQSLL